MDTLKHDRKTQAGHGKKAGARIIRNTTGAAKEGTGADVAGVVVVDDLTGVR